MVDLVLLVMLTAICLSASIIIITWNLINQEKLLICHTCAMCVVW
jgi:hypothetical protein